MAVDTSLVALMSCPQTHARLSLSSSKMLRVANERIAEGRLRTNAQGVLRDRIDALLVRADGEVGYAIRDDVAVLLPDAAIALSQLLDTAAERKARRKKTAARQAGQGARATSKRKG